MDNAVVNNVPQPAALPDRPDSSVESAMRKLDNKYVAELENVLQLRQQRVMVEECDQACKEMLRLITADVTTRRNEPVLKWEQSAPLTKSTVGLMVTDGSGLTTLLIGNDEPGSSVTISAERECTASTINSPGEAVLEKPHKRNFEVTLTRASTAGLIEKRRMFQLFT